MADEKLQLDITAKDTASAVVDKLQGKVDELETSDPVVDITADAKAADHTVDDLQDQLAKLTASDQIVVLALRAGAAQTELRDLATDLATIDAADPDVDVKFQRYAEVSGQLDDLEAKIRAIGDADPDAGANLAKAQTRLDGITQSAGRTQGAVHSMAGNAVGDFAATATGIGPLGEALGQLVEQASEGEASIRQLASAGVGMAGLAAAMYVVQGAMESIAETDAFHTAEVDAFVKSIKEGGSAAQDLATRLTDAGKIMAAPSFTNAANWVGLNDAVRDVTGVVTQAGLTVDTYTKLVTGSATEVGRWAQAQVDAGVDAKVVAETFDILTQAQKDYQDATKAAEQSTKFFTQTEEEVTAAADDYVRTLADVASSHRNQVTDTRRVINALRDAKTATDDLDHAYQTLQGTIDHDQSMINLENQIANVQSAAEDAWAAQVEANAALASGAKDAGEKQAAADQAARDYQTSINNLKTDIIGLGQTAGATTVDVDSTLDKVDQGDLDAVAADAEAYFRRNPIDAATRLKLISNLVAGVGQAVTISPGSAPTVNVTQVLPRGYHGDALGEATAAARRSGGLYRRSRR